MGIAVPRQLSGRQGRHRTIDMKAFVAVFAGIAAASAAPKADPWLLAAAPVYLGDAHTQTGDAVEHPNGAVVPDDTLSVKAARADHLLAKALQTPWGLWAHPLGKREADAEPYYGLYGYGVAPVVEAKKTGLIFTKGAVTPDFTDAVKEADPAIAADSKDIKVPVVTGYSVGYGYGKREAEPYYGGWGWGGYGGYGLGYYGKRSADADAFYGYGGYGLGYAVVPEIKPKATGFIVSPGSGAVTPDFTAEQKEANPEIADGSVSIDVPAFTGNVHVVGKREAEADPLITHWDGAVTPDYTPAQKVAAAAHFAAKGWPVWYGGYHLIGKREAEPYYGLGYGYGGYGLGYGGYGYLG